MTVLSLTTWRDWYCILVVQETLYEYGWCGKYDDTAVSICSSKCVPGWLSLRLYRPKEAACCVNVYDIAVSYTHLTLPTIYSV